MQLRDAPFYHDVAEGPPARAWWLHAEDGVRIRMAYWPSTNARGTVFLLPGRTEYIEKYGRSAADFAARGFAQVSIDWRGQGLADRLLDDRRAGYVQDFPDFQLDLDAVLQAAEQENLPKPYFIIGHSMGGSICLRALMENKPFNAAVFSAPMFGIQLSALMRPAAWAISWASSRAGHGHRFAPGTGQETYVLDKPFEGNSLTTDPDMYRYMQAQMRGYPDLALGGPSLHWLHEALRECRTLDLRPSPDVPCITFLGEREQIVATDAIAERMNRWPNGKLEMVPGGQHEVLMEIPELRNRIFDQCAALFAENS
ncbi:alpha/beta hydrolase [Shimia sp.]|uniref:alpha/beta hydrolase n=1 Tax=Shimia sp. TaxID=1954381 RepID=UPI0032981178